MKVLTAVVPCAGQFLSNIFLVPKHDGGHRLILNLKHLNEFVEKHHFKMETLKLHWHWLNQMLSLGVSIYVKHIKVFPFVVGVGSFYALFRMVLFRASCLYQITEAYVFCTAKVRTHNVADIDDSFLQSDTYDACVRNISDTLYLADDLGFTVHKEKSVVIPAQQIVFVGFLICSVTMTVRLPSAKCVDMIHLCKEILAAKTITIRKFAQLICKCVSVEPGIQYAALYYKEMEIERDESMKCIMVILMLSFAYLRQVNYLFSGGLIIFTRLLDLYVYSSLIGVLNLTVLVLAGAVMMLHIMSRCMGSGLTLTD
ncbi:MAG: hypothetical protein N0E48_25310 [Candidatus Thiodiazotropha endolucinida]|nr:hypothetical protein [Candidatus Thiodiazotropha taylori]MCW4346645.1 hypothetical protein [Candidatus Thiodiazotropha endolucinida]